MNEERGWEFEVIEDSEKEVENFARELGKKYIVQKGFHKSYKAVKRVGKGATAFVYSAIRHLDGKDVAIKSFKRSAYFASDNNNGKVFLGQCRSIFRRSLRFSLS